jgi:hypothetical protein
MSIPQKPYKIEIDLDQFPIRRVFVNFVSQTIYLRPDFNRLVVFCVIRAEEPLQYAYGMALLSQHVFTMSELEEIAMTEAVMQLIGPFVMGLPMRYQVQAECRLVDEFINGLKLARDVRQAVARNKRAYLELSHA